MQRYIFALLTLAIVGPLTAVTIHHYPEIQQEGHHHKAPIPIVKQDFQQSKEGYQFSYETGNGIHAQESGYIKNLGDKKHQTIVQQGSVTYHDEHGNPISLSYVADEHGFHPQGAHLPTPPPLPAEHQKAIAEQALVAHGGAEPQGQIDVGEHEYLQHQYAHY